MSNLYVPEKKSWASVKSNDDFIFIETHSGYRMHLADPDGERFILPGSSSDEAVGEAIIKSLSASRMINPKDDLYFFDIRGRVVPHYNAWVNEMMGRFGYKTKRAMFKGMKNCLVTLMENVVIIEPSHHVKLEAWDSDGITEDDYVRIDSDSAPAEVGAAFRLAASRCT